MKRPTMLLEVILKQFSMLLGLSVERDVACIQRRFEHEGFSFLAITLPKLSDALLQGIESGRFTCPTEFCRHGSLPRLLGGFFNRVFDRNGELREDVSPDVIFAIRSICDFWKKPEMPCAPAREQAAIENYLHVEGELALMTPQILREDTILDRVSEIIWSQVFPEIDQLDIVCHHGPGVTADRRLSNERHSIRNWYARSELYFPSDLHAYPNYGYAAEASGRSSDSGLEYWDVGDEPPVRVVFVPKTLKTPRVIAIEPSPMQFMQQGLLDYMVPKLESHYLTSKSIRFSDQTENQRLAHRASLDRSLATLDLKDASDRVHVELVRRIFQKSGVLDYLEAARSLHATLPDGRNVVLNKFASMGSAICFPVEAMVFYTLIQTAIHRHTGIRPSSRSIREYSESIAVYGDDIIVPIDFTDAVVRELESYGLRVNVSKSFRHSLFRESCGADFYKGVPVRPVYARQEAPDAARDWTAAHVASWVAISDQFYMNGLWMVSQAIRDMLESILRTRIPVARTKGAGISFFSLIRDTNLRFNRNTYQWEQRRIVYQPLQVKDDIDGNAVACLNKWGQARATVRRDRGSHWGPGFPNTSGLGDSPSEPARRYASILGVQGGVSLLDTSSLVLRGISCISAELDQRVARHNSLGELMSRCSTGSLNFQSSVKRGGFKSKRRWVTIAS